MSAAPQGPDARRLGATGPLSSEVVLSARDVTKHFPIRQGIVFQPTNFE